MKKQPDVNELKEKLRKGRKSDLSTHKETNKDKEEKVDEPAIDEPEEGTVLNDVTTDDDIEIDESVIERYTSDYDTPIEDDTEKEEREIPPKEIEQKPKKKISKKKVFRWILIVLAIILIGFILWYLISDASDVKDIEIKGNEHLSEDEIKSRSEITEGDKMYLANVSKAEKNISMLPIVEKIEVNRDYPNKVQISVKEYDIVAYVESKGRYYPVLENEQVLRGFDMTPTDAPIIHFFDGAEFEGLVKNLNQINPQILEMMSEIFYRPNEETNSRIQIYMNDGQEIIADLNTVGEKINYYAGMKKEIGDQTGVIDLEVSNTFLPGNSEEVARLKKNIHNIPTKAPYLEDINSSLDRIKRSLDGLKNDNEK